MALPDLGAKDFGPPANAAPVRVPRGAVPGLPADHEATAANAAARDTRTNGNAANPLCPCPSSRPLSYPTNAGLNPWLDKSK